MSPTPHTTLGDEECTLLCQLQGINANAPMMSPTTTTPTEPAASMALTIWTTDLHHPTRRTSAPLPSDPGLTTDNGSDFSKCRRYGSWADDSPRLPRCLACMEWDVYSCGSTIRNSAHARRWNHRQPYCSRCHTISPDHTYEQYPLHNWCDWCIDYRHKGTLCYQPHATCTGAATCLIPLKHQNWGSCYPHTQETKSQLLLECDGYLSDYE